MLFLFCFHGCLKFGNQSIDNWEKFAKKSFSAGKIQFFIFCFVLKISKCFCFSTLKKNHYYFNNRRWSIWFSFVVVVVFCQPLFSNRENRKEKNRQNKWNYYLNWKKLKKKRIKLKNKQKSEKPEEEKIRLSLHMIMINGMNKQPNIHSIERFIHSINSFWLWKFFWFVKFAYLFLYSVWWEKK